LHLAILELSQKVLKNTEIHAEDFGLMTNALASANIGNQEFWNLILLKFEQVQAKIDLHSFSYFIMAFSKMKFLKPIHLNIANDLFKRQLKSEVYDPFELAIIISSITDAKMRTHDELWENIAEYFIKCDYSEGNMKKETFLICLNGLKKISL
jgi:hypothetical protein